MAITPHQRSVLAYIRQFQQERRYSPSLDDLRVAFGLQSTNAMFKVVGALRDAKHLDLDPQGRICFPKGTFVPQPL